MGGRQALAGAARAAAVARTRAGAAGRTVLRGGLAVSFGLQPRRALLNDVTPHLIARL